VVIKALRARPGRVQFRVTGKRGSYPVDATAIPLTGLLVLDPPTAETGQCGEARFAGPAAECTADGTIVRCQ
jgi:hypothetical protein